MGSQRGGRETADSNGNGSHLAGRFGVSSPAALISPAPSDGRVALVSGGNRGVGLQIVGLLAERGMRVVLGSRSAENGRIAIEQLGDLAGRVAVRQLDVTDATSVDGVATWIQQRLGRCDVLINNAALLMDDDGQAATIDLEVVRRTVETNLIGTWRLTQAVVPLMTGRRYGRIVNMSSGLASLRAVASMGRYRPAYRISKHAVNSLTRILAAELAKYGILVNACSPDPVRVQDRVALIGRATPADTPVWLATLPDDGPTGGFYSKRVPVDW